MCFEFLNKKLNKNGKILLFSLMVGITVPLVLQLLFYHYNVEKKIVYSPSDKYYPVSDSIKKKTAIGHFKNFDNQRLEYWYIKGEKDAPVVLYCHGNEKSMGYFQNRVKFLVDQGYGVFMFDYRGFGQSEGFPDEEGLYSDLNSMLKIIADKYKIKPKNLIIWGHSLGGAVVADIATRNDFKGVILEGTFTRLSDMRNYAAKFRSSNPAEETLLKMIYSTIPLTQKFETIDKVARISSPLLIIHSKTDEIVPCEMSKKLAHKNKHAKLYLAPHGQHEGTDWNNHPIVEFIKSIAQ